MKAKELINTLKLLPDDTEIFLSRDSEGNSYMPVDPTVEYYENINAPSGIQTFNQLVLYPTDEQYDFDDTFTKLEKQ